LKGAVGSVTAVLLAVISVLTFFGVESGIRASLMDGETLRQGNKQVSNLHSVMNDVCDSDLNDLDTVTIDIDSDQEFRFKGGGNTNITLYEEGEPVAYQVLDRCSEVQRDTLSSTGLHMVSEEEEKTLMIRQGYSRGEVDEGN
jgi:hypothetical protein